MVVLDAVCVDDCVEVVRSDGDGIDNFTLSRSDNVDVVDVDVVVVVMCVVECDDDIVVQEEFDMDDNNAKAR